MTETHKYLGKTYASLTEAVRDMTDNSDMMAIDIARAVGRHLKDVRKVQCAMQRHQARMIPGPNDGPMLVGVTERVEALLLKGMTFEEIVKETGEASTSIRGALGKLKTQGITAAKKYDVPLTADQVFALTPFANKLGKTPEELALGIITEVLKRRITGALFGIRTLPAQGA